MKLGQTQLIFPVKSLFFFVSFHTFRTCILLLLALKLGILAGDYSAYFMGKKMTISLEIVNEMLTAGGYYMKGKAKVNLQCTRHT